MVKSSFYGPRAVPMGPLGHGTTGAMPALPGERRASSSLVNFPDCSNGKPDSPDHKAHMAYSVAGRCPASHPLAVPEISIVLRYPAVSGDVFLASGGVVLGARRLHERLEPARADRRSWTTA